MMTVVVVASAVFARFLFVLRLDYAVLLCFFFFNDTATTEIYTLSLHDALPISAGELAGDSRGAGIPAAALARPRAGGRQEADRKSTRLNSSHSQISYAVFCLKKKKKNNNHQ